MKLLELFAGSKSVGKVAESMGIDVFSVDKFIEKDMDFVGDVSMLTKEFIETNAGVPDIIWASPVCSAWSKTGWFHYWDTEVYSINKSFLHKHPFAIESVDMVLKVIEIVQWFPNAIFYMENPDGMLQFHPVTTKFKLFDTDIFKHLVTYCTYGDTVRKPTNIWTNNKNWKPRAICNNGDKCHLQSPRCTQRGILSKKNSYERSRIPEDLCNEILLSAMGEPYLNLQPKTKQNHLF